MRIVRALSEARGRSPGGSTTSRTSRSRSPSSGSNFSTARMRPMVPSWMRSRSGRPSVRALGDRPTRRRLASIMRSLARGSPRPTRRASVISSSGAGGRSSGCRAGTAPGHPSRPHLSPRISGEVGRPSDRSTLARPFVQIFGVLLFCAFGLRAWPASPRLRPPSRFEAPRARRPAAGIDPPARRRAGLDRRSRPGLDRPPRVRDGDEQERPVRVLRVQAGPPARHDRRRLARLRGACPRSPATTRSARCWSAGSSTTSARSFPAAACSSPQAPTSPTATAPCARRSRGRSSVRSARSRARSPPVARSRRTRPARLRAARRAHRRQPALPHQPRRVRVHSRARRLRPAAARLEPAA